MDRTQKNRSIVFGILLIVLISTLSACAVGPFEISLRDSSRSQGVDLTVTAVYATNTQIAAWRTSTAAAPAPLATAIPQQTTLSPATVAPPSPSSDIQLLYSLESFALINTAGRPLDIAGISFHSVSGELMSSQWDNGYLSAPLVSFPAGDCLMAWGLGTDVQPKPAGCQTRHAWITVNSQQSFWQTADTFGVRWYGQPITDCMVANGVCNVNLP